MKSLFRLLICILVLFLAACEFNDNPAEERAERAEKASGDIIVGAAAPWSSADLWNGIELAIEEINGSGGIMGRQLKVIREDDQSSLNTGLNIAHRFSKNPNLVAVLGHYNSYISLPCSIIYQYYGVLMLTPYSSIPKLTEQGFNLVFRNTISDEAYGRKLSQFSYAQGYRNILIYHSKNKYGMGFANEFEKNSELVGLNVVDRLSYDSFAGENDFDTDLKYWKDNFNFDAIFLAGTLPQAGIFIREARKIGITVPIVTGAGLDSQKLLDIAGEAANETFVGTLFQPENQALHIQVFTRKYFQRYQILPNNAAAQGYDSVKVLAQAMDSANSTVPQKVAAALRKLEYWNGPLKKSGFDENGDIEGWQISIKVVRDNQFQFYQ